ncbi:MAG TPA: hypothetical protein VNI84_03455 [Pyrinomonadaceae bacterium]|nr:hypothetical protein [Pyrinomonadaceae bacterium]
MNQRFFSFACAALLFLFAVNVSAQSSGKILKQAARAIGGEKLRQSQKSFQKKGTITRLRDGASGTFQAQGAQPNLYNTSFELNGFETEYGFNGKSGWTRDSRDGLRTLTGEASRDFQVEAAFRNNLWLNYKKEKAKIIAGGQSNIDGKPANLLIYTTGKGVPVKLFFDKASGLLLREEIRGGETAKIFDYGDYRKVDGTSEPFSIKQTIGEDVYEIKLDRITHNAPVAAAEFDFPKISSEPLPDIPALLKALQANEDKVDEILENYSYTQKIISRGFDKDGALNEKSSQTFQLSFHKGNRMARLIEREDRPLTANEQADEDKKVEKRVAEIDRKIAKQEAKAAAQSKNKAEEDDDDRRISVAELLRASILINPRREIFRGREVIVFDFEPNPNFDYKNAESFLKLFGKTMGVMWIDARDKQVARVEAVLADNFKIGGGVLLNLSKGASFSLEQERMGDEIWLPSVAEVNLPLRVLLVAGFNLNNVVKTYNYRKFATEVKDAKVDEIKQP